jgi:Family of unknown function (DUF6153)
MTGSLSTPLSVVQIRPRTAFLGFVLVVSVVTGLVFMHLLVMAPSDGQAHAGGRTAMVDMEQSVASVGDSSDAYGGGGGHAGDVCVSSTTKVSNFSSAATEPVFPASLPGPVSIGLPEAAGNKADLFSLCVLRR